MERTDYLILGGGIAGLTFALEVADHGQVIVLFKKDVELSNTAWAQGGIAAVNNGNSDSFELHIHDTENSGADLCNPETVRNVISEGPARVEELIQRGANFDRTANSDRYDLHQEGGHSKRRIYHSADKTGYEIQRALLQSAKNHPNIKFFTNSCAIDLITTHKLGVEKSKPNSALGAYVLLEDGKVEVFIARATMVATGGAGKVYLYTSNPDIATGDGVAMCFRAGTPVANLEFFQFHPTCLYHPKAKTFLITEAMRGEGAKLLRVSGEPFMAKYHQLEELAPRDVVARAIDNEMKSHGEEFVLLDISHRPADFVIEHFPTIHRRCLELGFDITTTPIPVVPAAHYCCGGVMCNEFGETVIRNLYVSGEVAHTGLHGANRLASNSLLEALVYSYRAAKQVITRKKESFTPPSVPEWNVGSAVDSDEQVVVTQNWDEIRRCMWNYVGIVRSDKRLERALHRSDLIDEEIRQYYWDFKVTADLLELRNLSLVSNLVIQSALFRKESRGLHFNIDYPDRDELFRRDTVITPEYFFHFKG